MSAQENIKELEFLLQNLKKSEAKQKKIVILNQMLKIVQDFSFEN